MISSSTMFKICELASLATFGDENFSLSDYKDVLKSLSEDLGLMLGDCPLTCPVHKILTRLYDSYTSLMEAENPEEARECLEKRAGKLREDDEEVHEDDERMNHRHQILLDKLMLEVRQTEQGIEELEHNQASAMLEGNFYKLAEESDKAEKLGSKLRLLQSLIDEEGRIRARF